MKDFTVPEGTMGILGLCTLSRLCDEAGETWCTCVCVWGDVCVCGRGVCGGRGICVYGRGVCVCLGGGGGGGVECDARRAGTD